MTLIFTAIAIVHALTARAVAAAFAPAPLLSLPAAPPLASLTVAELRRVAARSGMPRRLYTYGRRAELIAALA